MVVRPARIPPRLKRTPRCSGCFCELGGGLSLVFWKCDDCRSAEFRDAGLMVKMDGYVTFPESGLPAALHASPPKVARWCLMRRLGGVRWEAFSNDYRWDWGI